MFKRCPAWVGLFAVLFIAVGCGYGLLEPTPLDKNWGKSFERAKISQELDPEACGNLSPVTGLDGQAAENDMQRYRESQGTKKDSCDSVMGTKSIFGTIGASGGQ